MPSAFLCQALLAEVYIWYDIAYRNTFEYILSIKELTYHGKDVEHICKGRA